MPSQPKTTIARQLNTARLAINNTLADNELLALVASYGYTSQRMLEGQQLYERAVAAVNAQTIATGTRMQARAQASAAKSQAHASYQSLAQLARALFAQGSPQRATLGLNGKTPHSVAAFLAASNTLFDNGLAVEGIRQTLESYGYGAERLAQERAQIGVFAQANQLQAAANSAAQQSSHEQRAALTELGQWVARYHKIAKIALRDKPALIEKIGGAVRSTRTAAQRGGPKKAAATRAANKAAA